MKQSETIAVGLDGCGNGWVAAGSRGPMATAADRRTELIALDGIGELAELSRASPAALVAIDIPIGLTSAVGYRRCDLAAKATLTGSASTVSCLSPRGLLDANSYTDVQHWVAEEQALDASGKGLNRKSFALIPKVKEVDEWLRADLARNARVFECHPELAFRRLNGGLPLASKRSPAGAVGRLDLVSSVFPDARAELADFSPPGADLSDALDAYAALSVAVRAKEGISDELGDGEVDECGLPRRIVN